MSQARETQSRSLVPSAFALVPVLMLAFGAGACGGGASTSMATAGKSGAAGATGGSTAGTTGTTGGASGSTAGNTGATGGSSGQDGGVTGGSGGAAGATGGSSGQDGGATPDASTDAVVPTDASTSGADGGSATCGAAPLDPIIFNLEATQSFKGTGTFTSNGCVGKSIPWSSGTGPLQIGLTDGATVWVRMDPVTRVGDPDFLPAYFPELKPIAGFNEPVTAVLWDVTSVAKVKAQVPSFNQTTMSILTVGTALDKTGKVAPCNTNDGVTYAVPGHAEAVVLYAGNGDTLSAGPSTFADGTAYITLLPTSALEYITVVGTKAGCTLRTVGYVFTGRFPVAPGTTSTAIAF
jgi:hypothetical protein